MNAEEVRITYGGYPDTTYASCGMPLCTQAILRAVGVPDSVLEDRGTDLSEEPIGVDTTVTVILLGESDSCSYCAACGEFVQHGLRYPNEVGGCAHELDEWGDVIDPPHREGPHIDLSSHPAMRGSIEMHVRKTDT